MIATISLGAVLEYGYLNWNRLDQLSSKMGTALALGPTPLDVLEYSKTGQQFFGYLVANPPPHAIESYRYSKAHGRGH